MKTKELLRHFSALTANIKELLSSLSEHNDWKISRTSISIYHFPDF